MSQKITITEKINKLAKEVSEKHNTILDDFCKAYIVSCSFGMTPKRIRQIIKRLELTQQSIMTSNGIEYIWSFRLKKDPK
jgi:uncharacterized FlaG/YvyC family protein